MAKETIVITSASGKQAAPLIHLLTTKDTYNIRLIVHSEASQTRLQQKHPAAEVLRADLTEPSDCIKIVHDASIIYHIGPSFHPSETAIGQNMINAALQTTSIKHFIYSSVLNTQLRKLMNHDCKRYVEESLIESGLDYTILSPTNFMDMFPVPMFVQQIEQGKKELSFPAPWDADVKFTFVALKDLAEAAMVVIEGREKHFRAKYDMVSTGLLSYGEVCGIVGDVLGRQIVVQKTSFEDAVEVFL